MSLRSPSFSSTFGRAPPADVPCSRAVPSAGVRGRPASSRSAAVTISSRVASDARAAQAVALAWKSSAPMRSDPDSSR